MIDRSLIFQIRQLRARGKTYDEIASALHISKSTISKAVGVERSAVQSSTASPTSPLSVGQSYIMEKSTIGNDSPLAKVGYSIVDGDTDGTVSLNIKRTKIIGGPDGLRIVSIDNRPSNSYSIIGTPLSSWFWKLFFIFIGIVIFIRILKKMRGDSLEDD